MVPSMSVENRRIESQDGTTRRDNPPWTPDDGGMLVVIAKIAKEEWEIIRGARPNRGLSVFHRFFLPPVQRLGWMSRDGR